MAKKYPLISRFLTAVRNFELRHFEDANILIELLSTDEYKLRRAYHEAGHLVAGKYCGEKLRHSRATLDPFDDLSALNPFEFWRRRKSGGFCNRKAKQGPIHFENEDDSLDYLALCYAGPAAEKIEYGNCFFPISDYKALGLVAYNLVCLNLNVKSRYPSISCPPSTAERNLSRKTIEEIWTKSNKRPVPDLVVQKMEYIFEQARSEGMAVVARHRDELKPVAKALFILDTLEEQELAALLDRGEDLFPHIS